MESILCHDLLTHLHDSTCGKINIGQLVTDDDSTLRQHCSSVENGGKLRTEINQPTFLADPSHRCKVMLKKIFGLVTATRKADEVKNIDALRLRKYTGCYITQNRNGDFDTFVKNARAPVEHLFSNHEFCDLSCCWFKEIEDIRHGMMVKKLKTNVRNTKQYLHEQFTYASFN